MRRRLIAPALLVVFGCSSSSVPFGSREPRESPPVPRMCEYVDIQGVAVVTSVEEAEARSDNCRDPVDVRFDFHPDDPTARDRYLAPDWPDVGRSFFVGDGKSPPEQWIVERGIAVGNEYRCLRREAEVVGDCTPGAPVVYELVEIDMSGWEDHCF